MTSRFKVTLCESDQIAISMIASLKNGLNFANGVHNQRITKRRGDFEIHLDGLGGEMAFAQLFNLCPTIGVLPKRGGADFVTAKNQTLDVKTTPLEDGSLLVKESKRNDPCDLYVLMTGSFPTFTYRGCVAKEELFTDKYLSDLTHGPCYKVPQSDLSMATSKQ